MNYLNSLITQAKYFNKTVIYGNPHAILKGTYTKWLVHSFLSLLQNGKDEYAPSFAFPQIEFISILEEILGKKIETIYANWWYDYDYSFPGIEENLKMASTEETKEALKEILHGSNH